VSKYGAIPTVVDGIRFDSRAEAKRYGTLKMLEGAGKIADLRLQPDFPFTENGKIIFKYVADFSYLQGGKVIVEDVKGVRTAVYRLKKRLIEARCGVEIIEISA
jgi:hypothetical protein